MYWTTNELFSQRLNQILPLRYVGSNNGETDLNIGCWPRYSTGWGEPMWNAGCWAIGIIIGGGDTLLDCGDTLPDCGDFLPDDSDITTVVTIFFLILY